MNQKDTKTNQRVTLPAAPGVCNTCLQSNEQTGTNGTFIITYCQHNQAGAVMEIRGGTPSGLWKIYAPITADEFSKAVADASAIAHNAATKPLGGRVETFHARFYN